MTWQVPWVISGVTEVPLTVSRVLAYAATGGSEGVVSPTDLSVKQMDTPGTSIVVRSGAFACLNKFGTATNESYVGYNVGNDTVPVTATGASQRYDLVYAAITDPGQPGNPTTPAPVQTKIIQGVSSTVTRLQDVPGYATASGYALARLNIPASTATIQQSMITDLRKLLFQKTEQVVKMVNLPTGSDHAVLASYGVFPTQATWNIAIPIWATRMTAVAWVDGWQVRGTTAQDWQGLIRLRTGTTYSPEVELNWGITAGTKDNVGTVVGNDAAIAAADRGTTQTFSVEVHRTAGIAQLWSSWGTVVVLQVTFFSATEVGS